MKKLRKRLFQILIIYVIYVLITMILIFKVPYYKKSDLSFNVEDMYNVSEVDIYANIIETNNQAMDYRLNIINQAQESIKLIYYQYEPDKSGKILTSSLLQKADEGVKVEMILDGTLLKGRTFLKKLNNHPNIDIYIYDPLSLLLPYRNNNVTHDKIITVDERYAIIGGRNISNRFLLETNETTDRDLLVFNEDYKIDEIVKINDYLSEVRDSKYTKTIGRKKDDKFSDDLLIEYNSYMEDIYQYSFSKIKLDSIKVDDITFLRSPINRFQKDPVVLKTLLDVASNYDDVLIQSPYITSSYLIKSKFNSEKSVTLLTNNTNTNPNNFALTSYLKIRKKLANKHNLYEVQDDYSHHSKTMIFGDELSYIGTSNMDYRSTFLSLESGIIVHSKDFNDYLTNNINDILSNSLLVDNNGKYVEDENVDPVKNKGFKQFILKAISYISFLYEEML